MTKDKKITIPCPMLEGLEVRLTEEQSFIQREIMGRAFADWLWNNANGDFVQEMLSKLQKLKERSEKVSVGGGISFNDGIKYHWQRR